mgnify:CR=1 FL=1
MLISYSHRFIFVHIYKVAGSSVRRALGEYAHDPNRLLANRLLRRLGMRITLPFHRCKEFPVHMQARDIREELPPKVYDRFYKFAFVRNPWDWQVSLYYFMLQNTWHFQHKLVGSVSGFDEYMEWRVTEDKHLQKDFVTDENGIQIVDFVGRYERLSKDFLHVCRALNIRASLPHVNKSSHGDYRSYYNDRTKRMVEEHFGEDIEFFGYTFDE